MSPLAATGSRDNSAVPVRPARPAAASLMACGTTFQNVGAATGQAETRARPARALLRRSSRDAASSPPFTAKGVTEPS